MLYTRWEYVDRNQMAFHHLWLAHPDGIRQTVFFGNQHPGTTMIDARPIPGSHRVVASFSPGHGIIEHAGTITLVDPRAGPDDLSRARRITRTGDYRDPWAFSEDAFLAARGPYLFLVDGKGRGQILYKLPDADIRRGLQCHEPRPLVPHPREPIIPSLVDGSEATGRLIVLDIYQGRNMLGVRRGEIRRLLVLETLPKPINYTGGMEPLSYGGTFTLERILGTVPVEPDGSAYFEAPALRSLFFVALDENELSVRRMQSFLTVLPGETTGCIGCHESRTAAPPLAPPPVSAGRPVVGGPNFGLYELRNRDSDKAPIRTSASGNLPATHGWPAGDDGHFGLYKVRNGTTDKPPTTSSPNRGPPPSPGPGFLALCRAPSRIEPFPGIPDVLDFPRDIQPILNEHCVRCHDEDKRGGGLSLSGDRGPIFSISYYALTARDLISDGRNGLGNRPPRSIGSSASRLLKFLDGTHYGAKPAEHQQRVIRLWIDSGAVYPGTYAALGTGMIGGFEIVNQSIRLDRSDTEWPSTKASAEALQRRCGGCHGNDKPLPLSPSHIVGPGAWGSAFTGNPPWTDLAPNDARRRWSRHLFYNLTRPEKSLLLLAPLAKAAGGLGICSAASPSAGKAGVGAPGSDRSDRSDRSDLKTGPPRATVFADTADPDYRKILLAIQDAKAKLDAIKRFDMPGFRPRAEYLREMQRFGILPAGLPAAGPVDAYATDRAYWQSLWYRPIEPPIR